MEQGTTYRFETPFEEKDILFYNVRQKPFEIYGLYDVQNQPIFCRIPASVAEQTSKAVARLAWHTAGGRVRFSTD